GTGSLPAPGPAPGSPHPRPPRRSCASVMMAFAIKARALMPKIHVIYENEAWLDPMAAVLEQQAIPWSGWEFSEGDFDLAGVPREEVFYYRLSASAHSRGHRHSVEYAAGLLAWLDRHGRRVINGSVVVDLEISKVWQYAALEKAGIPIPRPV